MQFSLGGDFQQWLFLGFRALAAAGGFIAGFLLAGPMTRLLWRLAFQRPVPAASLSIARWLGGLLLGLVVFLCLPLGWGGGGGGGTGGGKGKGVGPHSGDGGVEMSGKKGTGEGIVGKTSEPTKATQGSTGKEVLVIELLGGDAVKDGKYYLIERKAPAVDVGELTKYLDQNLQRLAAIDIVLTDNSVGESHQAARQLQSMAQDRKLRSLVDLPKSP